MTSFIQILLKFLKPPQTSVCHMSHPEYPRRRLSGLNACRFRLGSLIPLLLFYPSDLPVLFVHTPGDV